MKQLIVIFLITFFAGGQVSAQHGNMNTEKRKEIKEKQKQFIINKLQLTEKEKRDFIPVYEKYTSEREKLYIEKHKAMRNFKQNSLNMSDDELLNLSDKFINIELKSAQLCKKYNEQFKKVLPPVKIILLYQAENEFKKQLIKKMHHKQVNKKKMP